MSHADLIAQVRAGVSRAPISPRTTLQLASALEEAADALAAYRTREQRILAVECLVDDGTEILDSDPCMVAFRAHIAALDESLPELRLAKADVGRAELSWLAGMNYVLRLVREAIYAKEAAS